MKKEHFPAKSRKFQIGEKVNTKRGTGKYIGCYYTINQPKIMRHPQMQCCEDGTHKIVLVEYFNYEGVSFKNYYYQVKFKDGKTRVFNQITKIKEK